MKTSKYFLFFFSFFVRFTPKSRVSSLFKLSKWSSILAKWKMAFWMLRGQRNYKTVFSIALMLQNSKKQCNAMWMHRVCVMSHTSVVFCCGVRIDSWSNAVAQANQEAAFSSSSYDASQVKSDERSKECTKHFSFNRGIAHSFYRLFYETKKKWENKSNALLQNARKW